MRYKRRRSPHLHLLFRPTAITPLNDLHPSLAIIFLLDILKLVRVFFRLPPLELVVPRPFPQTTRQSCLLRIRPATTLHSLAQTLLELFLPLPLLVLLSALPFLIQTFLAAPLVPCDFLHLL